MGRGVASRMEHRPFRLQGSVPGSTAWRGGDQELQPGLVQGEQWRWLPGCPMQPSININHSCSLLPGPGETQAFGGPFGCCSNLQSKKPDDKACTAECVLAHEAKGAERPGGEPEGVFRWPVWQRGRRTCPSPQTPAAASSLRLALPPARLRWLFMVLWCLVGEWCDSYLKARQHCKEKVVLFGWLFFARW